MELTLLIRKSFSSKCRPNIFGDSPGMGSIFIQTSMPFRAVSSDLWLNSMLVTIPSSTNCNNDKNRLIPMGYAIFCDKNRKTRDRRKIYRTFQSDKLIITLI